MKKIYLLFLASIFLLTACGNSTSKPEEYSYTDKSADVQIFDQTVNLRINSIIFGYIPEDKDSFSRLGDKLQAVRLETMIINNSEDNFSFVPTNINLCVGDENYEPIMDYVDVGILQVNEIPTGEELSGYLFFEIPSEIEVSDTTVCFQGYDENFDDQISEIDL